MAILNFRVEDDMKPKIEARAAQVRYRSVGAYIRELIEADLEQAGKTPRKSRHLPQDGRE